MLYVGFNALKNMMQGPNQNRDLGVQPTDKGSSNPSLEGQTPQKAPVNPLSGLVPDAMLNPYGDSLPKFSKGGPPHTVAWPLGSEVDFDVILTEEEDFNISTWRRSTNGDGEVTNKDPSVLFSWHQSSYIFGSSKNQEDRVHKVNLTLTPSMANNASVYAHIFVTKAPYGADPASERKKYLSQFSTYKRVKMNKHRLRKKDSEDRNLLGEWHEQDADVSNSEPAVEDASLLGVATVNRSTDVWLSYWKPTLHMQLVNMVSPFPRGAIPDQFAHQMEFVDLASGQYYPVLYINDFWLTNDKMPAINGTRDELPLELSISSIGMFKWQGMSSMQHQWKMQEAMGGRDGESDVLVNMITDTNPVLLAVTIVVSTLHSVFDILAFKNDIAFFKGKKSMEGLSIRTMVVNLFFQVVIFLYLFDNDTSFMILISNGVGLLIEFWKVTKAVKIGFTGGKITWKEDEGYKNNKTKEVRRRAKSCNCVVKRRLMV